VRLPISRVARRIGLVSIAAPQNESVDINLGEVRSVRRWRWLAFQSFQPGQDILQEDQAIVDLPIPAVKFPEQEPKYGHPGSDQNVAQINS
jgi:hypothetical protein